MDAKNTQFERKVSFSTGRLLDVLSYILSHYQYSIKLDDLIADVSMENGDLTDIGFQHGLNRLDFHSFFENIPFIKLAQLEYPFILITSDNQYIPFLEKSSLSQLDSMNERYSGQIILLKRIDSTETNDFMKLFKDKKWFWDVIKKGWAAYSEILVASFLINSFALALPLFIMNVYDRVVPNQAITTLWVLASGIFLVILFDFILKNLRSYFIDTVARNIDRELISEIYNHFLSIKMNSRPESVGSMANRLHSYEYFRDFITSVTMTVLVDLPFMFLFILVIAILSPWLAIVPLIAIPIIIFFGIALQRPINKMLYLSNQNASKKQGILIESLSNIELIKAYQLSHHFQSRFESSVHESHDISSRLRVISNLGIYISFFLQQLSSIVLIIVGVYLISNGMLTVGALIAASILLSRSLSPASQLSGLIVKYQQSNIAINSLDSLMNLPVDRPDFQKYIHLNALTGDISFQQVTFSYHEKSRPILEKINIEIQKGEKIGIIGSTGSGKSSLLKLLMHFYEPTSGAIQYDGLDLLQIDPNELRRNISYLPQEVSLLSGTVKDNILYGSSNPVDDRRLMEVSKISGIDTFINQIDDGFNKQVGERGCYLSGGQRQMIAIARAIINDAPIMLFDELTSSIDDKLANHILERLKIAMADKTVLVITHKMNVLSLVDRLIVLDHGRIVADGKKDEIIRMLSDKQLKATHESG